MLGDILKNLRCINGYSQADVADAMGLSRSAIGMYELGSREPDIETIKRFAEFYRVSISYLLEQKEASLSFGQPEEEREIVKLFDAAPPEIQAAALAVLKTAQPTSSPSFSAISNPDTSEHTFFVAAQGGGVERRTTKATPEDIRKAIELDEKEYDGM